MNWNNIKYFKQEEFFGESDLLEEDTIISLDQTRDLLQEPIYTSPVLGAIARFNGSKTSQHYVGPSLDKLVRKSTAIDVFVEGIPFINFNTIICSELFTGVGVYLDTKGPDGEPWIMFHLDKRPKSLVWICMKDVEPETGKLVNKYFYPQSNNEYWQLLARKSFFTERTLN